MASAAAPPGMTEPLPVSDRFLLLAFIAVEAQSVADALNALADGGEGTRRPALEAQFMATDASNRWAELVNLGTRDPVDRLLAARQYLTDNIHQMQNLMDRLML